MPELATEIQQLERDCYRIVGMICSETVAETELQRAIDGLRRRTLEAFPERPSLFDETYGRRIKRLRTRFRPYGGLFHR